MNNNPAPPRAPINPPVVPRIRSEELFADGRVVVIIHAEREYQLRITTANKLILTA